MATHKILCLADLHLGVRPSRLPAAVAPEVASVATVWKRAVDLALEAEVGLVLLAGDVVWEGNPLEPLGPLERELRRLTEAGIEVCTVGGNHDFDVLPRLSRVLGGDHYHLLGEGGRWQRFTWRDPEVGALLHVDGWSFPSRDVRENPVESYGLRPPEDGVPVLGLVHGDLDRTRSTNAPLSRTSLERAGVDAWLLGHVHKPALIDLAGGRWALYPGSPQPLDPTEEGAHGAWLVELRDRRLGRPELAPLATLRWESLQVDASGIGDIEQARDRLVEGARAAARSIAAAQPELRHLLLKTRLVGRTATHRSLPLLVRDVEEECPVISAAGEIEARLAQLILGTLPPADLESLARSDDPPGILAVLLLELQAAENVRSDELLDRVSTRVREVYRRRHYLPVLKEEDLDPADRRERLAAAAWSLLDALLAQKASSQVGAEGTSGP
jgi:DNA repair exonuclease SbcCD nuclease subunit